MAKSKSRVLTLSFFVFTSVLALVIVSYFAFAQEEEIRIPDGFVLTPAIIERDVTPGEVVSLSVKVFNSNRPGETVYPLTASFTPDPGESGSPQFLPPGEDGPHSLASWISFSVEKIFVDEGGRREIPFTLAVPAEVEPGTHYGAVVVSREELGSGRGVGVGYDLATLVIVKVAGEVIEEGDFLSLQTNRKWYEYPPVTFLVRFENTGNVYISPTGVLEVFNMVGVKEGALQVNKSFGRTLPESIRRYEEKWDPGKWFGIIPRMGRYTATALMIHGNPSVSTSLGPVSFWLIPWKFLLTVVGVLALAIVAAVVFLRLYGRVVVSRHEKRRDKK